MIGKGNALTASLGTRGRLKENLTMLCILVRALTLLLKAKIAAMLEEAKKEIGAEGAVFPGCAIVVDRDQL